MQGETPGGPRHRPTNKLEDITPQERQKVNTFFSKLQVGDLCFTNIMPYALALFGQTKAGKTTLAHLLISNPLVGTSTNSYELKGGSKFLEALIGQTSISQTQIPNHIEKKIQNVDLHILDCPGYSDSKGCQMVIANGYFHYRIFSKVQNLKFLLVFDYKFMGDVYAKPAQTLVQFLLSFKNYPDIKEQIIEATSFVFTKLNKYGQKQEEINGNIEAKLMTLRNCGSVKGTQFMEDIQELIDRIIKKKCYFYFEMAKENLPPAHNSILQEIHKKTTFWKRSINKEDQQADLSHIQMTLGYRTRKMAEVNAKFKRDFLVLTQLFEERFKKAIVSQGKEIYQCSLSKITGEFFINSILGKKQQKSFYEDYILKFVGDFNIYSNNNFNSKKEYVQKRKKIKDYVLSVPNQKIDKSYVENIQKLQICKMIIEMVQKYQGIVHEKDNKKGRSIQQFKKIAKTIVNIIVQFKKIRFFSNSSKDKIEKQKEKEIQYFQNISQFVYIVYRLLQEVRIFKVLFSLDIEQKQDRSQQNQNILENVHITQTVLDYIQSINYYQFQYITFKDKDIFQKCKLTYLANHFQLAIDEPDYYYTQFQKYFCEIKPQTDKFFIQLSNSAKQKLNQVKLQKLKSNKLTFNERITTLLDYAYSQLSSLETGQIQAYQNNAQLYVDSINKLADQLSKFKAKAFQPKLQCRGALKYAVKLFKSTGNVFRTIECFKDLGKLYDWHHRRQAQELKDILLQYAAYASTHGRIELAIEVYQEAYSVIDWMFEKNQDDFYTLRRSLREQISEKIGMLGIDKRYSPSMQYYDALLKKKYFTVIETNILDQIKRDFSKK